MGKPGAFLTLDRKVHELRPVAERAHDFDPLYRELPENERRAQASRCMMCGVAFCQTGAPFGPARPSGCPLHNLIPEWNELVWRGRWHEAAARLALTNPLPEFTSRVCPALCEAACNLGSVAGEPTAIHDTERAISDWEWAHGGPRPFPPAAPDAPSVAVVGSGPAGLACAAVLARQGLRVTVVERADRAGGLLMYGIPNMKLEKEVVERRVAFLAEQGVTFRLNTDAAAPDEARALMDAFDAVVIAAGAGAPRTLNIPGADAPGVVMAVNYLTEATRALIDGREPAISAQGRDVVVIGGGDTGNDCLATAVRQGAASVHQLELMPAPPRTRLPQNPWPQWPQVLKTDYGQEEAIALMGGECRSWSVDTLEVELDADGCARALTVADLEWADGASRRVPGTERSLPASLVLVACGFTGPRADVLDAFGVALPEQGRQLPVMQAASEHRCARRPDAMDAATPVFACGDARNGASLVVSAIADAVACAREVVRCLG